MAGTAPNDRPDLATVVARLRAARVLVVGDVMLDRYCDGVVERLSPEAAAPVLRVLSESDAPGGAGNAAANAASLGGRVAIVSAVGDDDAAPRLRDLLTEAGVDIGGLIVSPGRGTASKTRFRMASGRHLLRADDEIVAPLPDELENRLLDEIGARLEATDVLVLSDYGKGVFLGDVAQQAIALARRAGVPVLVDPKGSDYGRYRGAALVTPNLAELAEGLGVGTIGQSEIGSAARRLSQRHDLGAVVVTLGERGAMLVDRSGEISVRARTVAGADATGAGDSFVAGLAVGLGSGLDPAEALHLAVAAAGIAAAKSGTARVRLDEIGEGAPPIGHGGGSQALERALDIVAVWRRAGLSIGFTNGCFDVVHAGHVHLLDEARAACDRLVVGLNSDESVRRLKGAGRPVHRLDHRARVLLGLRAVDLVVPFETPTPMALIDALAPDVLVKGSDYTIETIVGADRVLGRGGRVLLVDILPELGTTATLLKLEGGRP